MRQQHEIEQNGKTYLVCADVHSADPDAGIPNAWSEDHILIDPETENRLKDDEAKMTDEDWEEITQKFDEKIDYPEFEDDVI